MVILQRQQKCLYIYIYAVELKAGPRFGVSCVKTGPSLELKIGPIFHCFP